MDLTPIPRTFWHSLSLCVVLLSGAFVYVSVVEGKLTVKWDQLEVTAGEVDEQFIELQAQVQTLKIEKEQANIALDELQGEITNITTSLDQCENDEIALKEQLENISIGITAQKEINSGQVDKLKVTERELNVAREQLGNIVIPASSSTATSTILISNSWAKAGYYLSLENNIRLNVDSVTNEIVEVQIVPAGTGGPGVNRLKPGESFQFQSGGATYDVTLNSIGRAGFNRLTKAAYFTVTKTEV